MYYNLIKILSRITLALFFALFSINTAKAQGTVSLAEETDGDVLEIDNNLPDEISLFGDDNNDALLQPAPVIGSDVNAVKKDVENEILPTANSPFDAPSPSSETAKTTPLLSAQSDQFGDQVISQTDEKLFAQMSDLERQTALLTIELRREKIKTEIEAIKFQRQKAIQDEEDAKELKRREKAEWETEQQKKLLAEQAKLKAAEVNLEKIRQEKIIKAYKNHMLTENKKWIETLNKSYKEIATAEGERDQALKDFKDKLSNLRNLAAKIADEAANAKDTHQREIDSLHAQIAILNARIEALSTTKADGISNPFSAPGFGTSSDPNLRLSDEYIILEIKGKGDNLIAKVSNKSGAEAFLIQKGTVLKSGHIIEEIAPTYIRADRGGLKDYIYFSAGGILDKEPDAELKMKSLTPMGATAADQKAKTNEAYKPDSFVSGMFVN
ncbi:MAG: hypothetical protein ACK5N8_06915 [Alphaproteobacteria bacterium]